jgi:hypothetical protein
VKGILLARVRIELCSIGWFGKFEIQGETTLDILVEIGE